MIKEWTQKEWIKIKRPLIEALISDISFLKHATVKRYDDCIILEGSTLPLMITEEDVFTWRTAKRWSGNPVSITQLSNAKDKIMEWVELQFEAEREVNG